MGWESGTKREFKFDPNSTENEGRWRLYSPGMIEKASYFRRKSSTAGVSYVMGKASGGPAKGKSVIQAVRFDKEKFTEAEASKWWSKNQGRDNLMFSDERKKEAMNKTAVAKELVAVAKLLVGGGWRHYSEELCDVLEALPMVHKGKNNRQIIHEVHKDDWLVSQMKEEGMSDRELNELLDDSREMYSLYLEKR